MAKKPKFIDKAELKARIKDGNKKRRERGEMIFADDPIALPDPRGAHFTKAQRAEFQQLVELAIYELANHQMREWYHAVVRINEVMYAANFQKSVVIHTMKEIEHTAVQCTGDRGIYARTGDFLHRVRTRVISIPGVDPKHATTEAANYDTQNCTNNSQPESGRSERKPRD